MSIKFIKQIEGLINISDISLLNVVSPTMEKVPNHLQEKMIEKASTEKSYMGFIVEPYATFVCYRIKDLEYAKQLIPDGFKPVKTKIYEDDEPDYYAIFGCFNVRTSAFMGTRLEVNIIAENEETGLLTWVIVDYDTNAIGHDKKRGFVEKTTRDIILTTSHNGELIARFSNPELNRVFEYECDLNQGVTKRLDERLWQEGNLSVAYGRDISRNSKETFSLTFDTEVVAKADDIPVEDIDIQANTWFEGLCEDQPSRVVTFRYAQHYLSDSLGFYSSFKDVPEMVEQYERLETAVLPKYSVDDIRKSLKWGVIGTSTLFIILCVLLILK